MKSKGAVLIGALTKWCTREDLRWWARVLIPGSLEGDVLAHYTVALQAVIKDTHSRQG